MNPSMPTVDVSFITVNYFSREHTERCIAAIVKQTLGVRYEILVIDNHSDLDAAAIKALHPSVRVLMSPSNQGYGAALHLGAGFARGRYLYFLNNDTELLNDAAAIQARFMDEHPQAGLLGAQLLDTQGRPSLSFDYFPTLATKLFGTDVLRLIRPQAFPSRRQVYREAVRVDLVSGSSLFMPALVYRQVGGFDPAFFLYCEEEDLAWRVHQAGFAVYSVPQAQVRHLGGASSRNAVMLKKEFYISFFKFYAKHYGRLTAAFVRWHCGAQFAWRFVFHRNREVWRALLAWWWRGAPLSESLRFAPGNEFLPAGLEEV